MNSQILLCNYCRISLLYLHIIDFTHITFILRPFKLIPPSSNNHGDINMVPFLEIISTYHFLGMMGFSIFILPSLICSIIGASCLNSDAISTLLPFQMKQRRNRHLQSGYHFDFRNEVSFLNQYYWLQNWIIWPILPKDDHLGCEYFWSFSTILIHFFLDHRYCFLRG